MRLTEFVVAILGLISRMRDANLELTKQLAGLRRARPKSEKLKRIEGQLELAFMGTVAQARNNDDRKKDKLDNPDHSCDLHSAQYQPACVPASDHQAPA